jgi:hypothetical protein
MEAGAGSGISELVKMINATPSLVYPPAPRPAATGEGDGNESGGEGGMSGSQAAGPGRSTRKPKRPRSKGGAAAGASDAPADADASAASPTHHVLTRPVICICNDPYAPALRELRPLAQIVEFGHTATARLVDRLKAICRAENLTVTGEALRALAVATDNDIRSCLNTLQVMMRRLRHYKSHFIFLAHPHLPAFSQFVRAEATRVQGLRDSSTPRFRVTTDMITRAAVGIKDQTKALYDVLGAVFRKPDLRLRASRAALSEAPTEAAGGAFDVDAHAMRQDLLMNAASAVRAAHFVNLLGQLASYTSEPRLLLAGLYENLLHARVIDPSLLHTWAALDWLCAGAEVASRAVNQVGTDEAEQDLSTWVCEFWVLSCPGVCIVEIHRCCRARRSFTPLKRLAAKDCVAAE